MALGGGEGPQGGLGTRLARYLELLEKCLLMMMTMERILKTYYLSAASKLGG